MNRRLVLAIVPSVVLVACAPFIGEFRRWLAATLPGQYVWIVNGTVGLSALAVVLLALRHVRTDRARGPVSDGGRGPRACTQHGVGRRRCGHGVR